MSPDLNSKATNYLTLSPSVVPVRMPKVRCPVFIGCGGLRAFRDLRLFPSRRFRSVLQVRIRSLHANLGKNILASPTVREYDDSRCSQGLAHV